MTQPQYPVLYVEAAPDDVDVLIGRLTLFGADGIEERDASTLVKGGAAGVTLVASFAEAADAQAAHDALAADFAVRLDAVVGDAWRDAWKAHWKPTRITPTVVIVPNWLEYTPEPGDVVLRLDPGRAFGTGQHPSTALAARALETALAAGPQPLLLDLGCGSGILGFVALRQGVARVIGNDIDSESIDNAQENAVSLGLDARCDLRVGGFEVVPETASLVVANIEASVLVPHAETVAARVSAGGTLVLSGILVEQGETVDAAYRAVGLVPVGAEVEGQWVCPVFRRP